MNWNEVASRIDLLDNNGYSITFTDITTNTQAVPYTLKTLDQDFLCTNFNLSVYDNAGTAYHSDNQLTKDVMTIDISNGGKHYSDKPMDIYSLIRRTQAPNFKGWVMKKTSEYLFSTFSSEEPEIT